jgi:hypothetical protein
MRSVLRDGQPCLFFRVSNLPNSKSCLFILYSMLFLGGNPKEVYRFADEFEVELASRCCRDWTDYEDQMLNDDAVAMAESIIKVCEPQSAEL